MNKFRIVWLIQVFGIAMLIAVSSWQLTKNAALDHSRLIDNQQLALNQLLKNVDNDDEKLLVQQIRAMANPQLLQVRQTDGTMLYEHNNATSLMSTAEQIQKLVGFERRFGQLSAPAIGVEIRFKPNFDEQDQLFVTQLSLLALIGVLFALLPSLLLPTLNRLQHRAISQLVSENLDLISRQNGEAYRDVELPDDYETITLALHRFAEFALKQQSELNRTAEQLTEDAFKDSVTGLPNRNRFVQFYEENLRKSSHVDFGVFAIVRCSELQNINQSRGYQEGDRYITQVADLVQKSAAGYRDAKVYRLNSSDFGVLIPRVSPKDGEAFGAQLQSRFDEYQKLSELDSVAQTGLVTYEAGKPLGELLAIADTAISLAQTRQTNAFFLHKDDGSLDQTAAGYGNQNWRAVIDDVLSNDRISLLTQLIQPSNRSAKTYSEILVRFHTAEGQLLPTASLLAMAEKLDRIIAVDRAIIEHALTTIKNKNLYDHYFGINLSSRCVHDDQFMIWLERRLLKDASLANRLVFEISEYGLQQNLKTSKRFIDMLHRAGSRITVEKFGTGITSFKFFRDLKPDFIKMDGGYTRHIDEDKNNQYFMRLMVDLAHRIGVAVFAESVETQEEKHMLESLFIDGTQGYYIGKPQPL